MVRDKVAHYSDVWLIKYFNAMNDREKKVAHAQSRLDLANKLLGMTRKCCECFIEVDGERMWLSDSEAALMLLALHGEYKRIFSGYHTDIPGSGMVID